MQTCRDLFVAKFDEVKHTSGVLKQLYDTCLAKLDGLEKNEMKICECSTSTVNRGISLFLRIILYHKLKVTNRNMAKAVNVQRRNRKAIKVLHA
jgi:hypothetical protein